MCKDNRESCIEFALIKSSSKSYHLIFYNNELAQEFEEYDDQFGDGTFTICPNIPGVSQVLTVMGRKYNTVRF